MPRVNGVDIPANKRVDIALTYVYGIGHHTAALLLEEAKIAGGMRAHELPDEQVGQLTQVIQRK